MFRKHLPIISIALGTSPPPPGDGAAPLRAGWWQQVLDVCAQADADFVTIADHHRLAGSPGTGTAPTRAGRLDSVMIACLLAPARRRVGLVPMASATLTEPFFVSTQIATLDHISGGWGGWEIDVAAATQAARYVGPRTVPEGAERYAEAIEHAEVVRRLWDSWDDDAEIRDAVSHRFIDRERIHRIEFAGIYLRVLGPSITPRPPQGQPIIVAQVRDTLTQTVAAAVADIAIVAAGDVEELRVRADVARRAAADTPERRGPIQVLADVDVALDAAAAPATAVTVAGSPAAIADQLEELAEHGIDGFRLRPVQLPADLDAIAGPLRAELDRRGWTRDPGDRATLRNRLGLPRPLSAYVKA